MRGLWFWIGVLLFACAREAPEPELPDYGIVRVDRSSLRINPLPTASEIEFLPVGSRVSIVRMREGDETWYLVRTAGGLEGWIAGQALLVEGRSKAEALKPIITAAEIPEKLLGQWFETSLTGATGYFKIYFYEDGTYRHGHGLAAMKAPGRYQLLPAYNVILLEKGSGAGDFLRLRIIGRDLFLIGEENGYEIAYRRRFDDPDVREFKFE